MGYCRFQNTLDDLYDCYDHMADTIVSKPERKARRDMVELCQIIVANYADAWEEEDE